MDNLHFHEDHNETWYSMNLDWNIAPHKPDASQPLQSLIIYNILPVVTNKSIRGLLRAGSFRFRITLRSRPFLKKTSVRRRNEMYYPRAIPTPQGVAHT